MREFLGTTERCNMFQPFISTIGLLMTSTNWMNMHPNVQTFSTGSILSLCEVYQWISFRMKLSEYINRNGGQEDNDELSMRMEELKRAEELQKKQQKKQKK